MTPGRAGREVTVSSQILCMVSFVAPIATWRDREPWLPFLRPTRRPRAGALKARLGFGVQSARRDENRETQSEAGKLEKQRQTLDRRPPACCVAASPKNAEMSGGSSESGDHTNFQTLLFIQHILVDFDSGQARAMGDG